MGKKISIVFASSADFTLPVLKAFINDERYVVYLVLTNPPRPVGRKQIITKTIIHNFAEEHGIKVATFSSKKALTGFVVNENWRPDFLVVMAYGMIVEESVLNWPNYVPINGHLSILPAYRGASPVQAALLNNDPITGNTYIKMDKGMDTGPIFAISKLPIERDDTTDSLLSKLGQIAALDFPDLLPKIMTGEVIPEEQIGLASNCSKIKKESGEINFKELTAQEIVNKYRAYYPWPGIFFFDDDGVRQIIRELEMQIKTFPLDFSEIILENETCYFKCKSDYVGFKKIQTAGKSVLSAKDWFNGNKANKTK